VRRAEAVAVLYSRDSLLRLLADPQTYCTREYSVNTRLSEQPGKMLYSPEHVGPERKHAFFPREAPLFVSGTPKRPPTPAIAAQDATGGSLVPKERKLAEIPISRILNLRRCFS
jgi:hypothetical protein